MAVQLALFVLSVGLSILAGYLLQERDKGIAKDDKPTTVATRGSFVPWVLGLRRVGAVFAWAGDRRTRKESAGGKGLFSGPEVKIFYESGWHLLNIGETFSLHRIQQHGKVIFEGPITQSSHPSGSTIDLGKEGEFRIFWGEFGNQQPVNTFLGDAGRVGVSSRWPFFCYIEWTRKRLGPSPNWQLIDYTIERRPQYSQGFLSSSLDYIAPSLTLNGATFDIDGHAQGGEGSGYIQVDKKSTIRVGDTVRLTGNAWGDRDLEVVKVETIIFETGFLDFDTKDRIFPVGGVDASADDAGTLQIYTAADNDGVGPAHAIAELLFGSFPVGLGLDPRFWNVDGAGDSLDALGVLLEGEGIQASLIAQNGETAKALLGAVLQDFGTMIPINPFTGLIDFTPVRDAAGASVKQITQDMLSGNLPEIEKIHRHRKVDRLVFKFSDRGNLFRDMTIAIDSDGQASFLEHQRAREVGISSVVNFDAASVVAERRSQEEMSQPTKVVFEGNRSTRELYPGLPVEVFGFPDLLRVVGVKPDLDSGQVSVSCISDFMGAASSTFSNSRAGNQIGETDPQPDLQFDWYEVPAYLLASDPITVIVPRIRANANVDSSQIWMSLDNITYTTKGTDYDVQTGGTLDEALSSNPAERELGIGPELTLLGPDSSILLNLTGDETNWRLGRQLCLISSSAGQEICFVRNLTLISGDTWRLDGLIRARYDTHQLDHPVGAEVYVFPNTDIFAMQDIISFRPGQTIYVKSEPEGTSLSQIAPAAAVMRGKGVTPMDPANLKVTSEWVSDSYTPSSDIDLAWNYRSTAIPKTGAGLQGAGDPAGVSDPQGTFLLEFLTVGDVVVRQVSLTSPSYTYLNSDLVSDFSGEPASFKARVRNVLGSFASDNVELTINKLS